MQKKTLTLPQKVETPTTPEPTPEVIHEPAPVVENSEPTPAPEPPQPKPARKTTKEAFDAFDALIDSAPEEAEAPPIPEPTPQPAAEVAPEKETKTNESAEVTFDEDEFYKDPLIQNALEIFEATLKPA